MYRTSIFRWSMTTLLFLNLPVVAAEPDTATTWKGIRETMGVAEFRAAGLDKLSDEELRSLDQWLLHFLAYDSQHVVHNDETIKELQTLPVRRHIVGHFSGWKGETLFRLDNGEIWRQRLSGRYAVSLEDPEVEIFKNLFGFYELRVVATGKKIGVTRIK